MLSVSIQDVQGFRDDLIGRNAAPKTLNRRISSVSSFYKYLGAAAAELRLVLPALHVFIYGLSRQRSCW